MPKMARPLGLLRVSARGRVRGVRTPPLSTTVGDIPPLLVKKMTIYSDFAVISVQIRHFKHSKFKLPPPQTPHPVWTPLSNIPGGNPATIKQNVRFRGRMHPEIFQLDRIQNDRQSAIIYLDWPDIR